MVSEKHVRVLVLVNVLFFSSLISFAVCFVLAGRALSRAKASYHITVQQFNSAVSAGVSNYLASIVSIPDVSQAPVDDFSSPAIVYDDIGFGSTYNSVPYLIIEGYRYFAGDFCSHGEIVRIYPDRAYCRNSEGLVIVRPSRSVSAVRASRSGGGEEAPEAKQDGETREDNPRGLFGRVF